MKLRVMRTRTWEGSSLSDLRNNEAKEVVNLLEETEESVQLQQPRYWSQDSIARMI